MTTMTMTRRSRRFHFLYRDRDVRELQKKDLAERDESAVKKRRERRGGREADGTLCDLSARI